MTIPDYNDEGDDMFVELSTAVLREKIEASGMLDHIRSVVQQCITGMKGRSPDQLEIMDSGILTGPFHECVNTVCKENGIEISLINPCCYSLDYTWN